MGERLAPDCMCRNIVIYKVVHTDSLQSLGPRQPDIYEADGETDRTVVILWASLKGYQSPVYCCVKTMFSKDTEKLDTGINSIFTFYRCIIKMITILYEKGKNHR